MGVLTTAPPPATAPGTTKSVGSGVKTSAASMRLLTALGCGVLGGVGVSVRVGVGVMVWLGVILGVADVVSLGIAVNVGVCVKVGGRVGCNGGGDVGEGSCASVGRLADSALSPVQAATSSRMNNRGSIRRRVIMGFIIAPHCSIAMGKS